MSLGELTEKLDKSRALNPRCGCDKRGDMWFCCSYHEGFIDGYEAGIDFAKNVVYRASEALSL